MYIYPSLSLQETLYFLLSLVSSKYSSLQSLHCALLYDKVLGLEFVAGNSDKVLFGYRGEERDCSRSRGVRELSQKQFSFNIAPPAIAAALVVAARLSSCYRTSKAWSFDLRFSSAIKTLICTFSKAEAPEKDGRRLLLDYWRSFRFVFVLVFVCLYFCLCLRPLLLT